MTKQAWIIFAAVIVVGLGALIYLSRGDSIDVSGIDLSKIISTSDQIEEYQSGLKDRVYGNPDADTTLIVYGDFQCPGCATFDQRLYDVLADEKYEDTVRVVHRNFPIKSIHPNAFSAAAYAEAIAIQDEDAFWEFKTRLYRNQQTWSASQPKDRDGQILSFAADLDLDMDKVREDAKSERVNQKIEFDIALGKANGVNATPTIFLDGELTTTDQIGDAASIRESLDASIKKHSASGTEDKDAKREEEADKSSDEDADASSDK